MGFCRSPSPSASVLGVAVLMQVGSFRITDKPIAAEQEQLLLQKLQRLPGIESVFPPMRCFIRHKS